MIDGGCDPLYIARRLVRMASEDIGNADPRALSWPWTPGTPSSAWAAPRASWPWPRRGLPGLGAKSNAVYCSAWKAAFAQCTDRTGAQ
jgi:replication-associated recombination protein RarA